MTSPTMTSIPLTLLTRDGDVMGTATGFLVQHGIEQFLVTNWHVATGRHNISGRPVDRMAITPTTLRALHWTNDGELKWIAIDYELYGPDGNPLWFEHPKHGHLVDVVALPSNWGGFDVYPLSLDSWQPHAIVRGENVDVVGFPKGLAVWACPLWQPAQLMNIRLDPSLPNFFLAGQVGCGLSGSPVFARDTELQEMLYRKGSVIQDRPGAKFLGIYSGRRFGRRISDGTAVSVGQAWTVQALTEVVTGRHVGPEPRVFE